MRCCSHCEGPVEPGRDVCASCRRKLKFEALQLARIAGRAGNSAPAGGIVTVQLGPFGGPFSAQPSQRPPNRCMTCGGDAGWSRYAGRPVCERCAISLPMHVLEASVRRLRESGHPENCGCEGCYGRGKANWQRGGCPQCQGTLDPHGACHSCLFTPNASLVSAFGTPQHHLSPSMGFPSPSGTFSRGGFIGAGATVGVFAQPQPRPHAVPRERYSMESPDPERAPDLIEPVLAWRGWNVTPDGHLVAAAVDGIWDAGPNRAVCRNEAERQHTDVPAVGCNCGFYGWHNTKHIGHGNIWGAIKCWGEVIVHDCGIRAEWAEIVVLLERPAQPAIDPELLARVVDRYKVPIVATLAEAETVAASQGILVPMKMRPEPDRTDPFANMAAAVAAATNAGIAGRQAVAAMQQMGAALNATSPALQRFNAAVQQAERKVRPTPLVKLLGGLALSLVLVIGFGFLRPAMGWASWSGFPAGVVIGGTCYFTPLFDVLWRGWRRLRGR